MNRRQFFARFGLGALTTAAGMRPAQTDHAVAPASSSQLTALADEAAIRHLAARFSDAVNRRDLTTFRTLWIPNGVLEISQPFPAQASGINAIVGVIAGRLQTFTFFVEMTHSGVVSVNGNHATARWTMQEVANLTDGKTGYNNYAIYDDALVKVNGAWLFARRTYYYQYLDHVRFPGQAVPLPAHLR